MAKKIYDSSDFSKKEQELVRNFHLQRNDAKRYFKNVIKPRLDRSYKLYINDNSDRKSEIKSWQCISEDTDILSPDGWKNINNIKKNDTVFSYDIENEKILKDKVNSVFVYNVDDKLISIKNSITDQLITDNHRVLLKKCVKGSKTDLLTKIRKRPHYWDEKFNYYIADSLVNNKKEYRIPVSGIYDGDLSIGGDWAELIGWFLTDGSFGKGKNYQGYITQSKPETLVKLRSLLLGMDIKFREWSRKKEKKHYFDEHRFYFDGKSEIMKKMWKWIPNKKPSNLLWNLKLSEKRRLIEGICYGDGSKWPNGKYHMVIKPKKDFLEWFQVLLHLTGLRGRLANGKSKNKYINISYKDTIDINGKKHVSSVKYKGKVWSISTKRTNYIARRNGLIFITGNSNVFIPYIHSIIETLKPRILDARPDFTVQGRNEDDQTKAKKIQELSDYTWEISESDKVAELITSSSLIYGMGYMQPSWKKDVRKLKFLNTNDIANKKYSWKKKERVFYDAPIVEWVDNYSLWYDWHNNKEENKQYWFKRLLLTEPEIRRRYPMAEEKRLKMAFESGANDLTDYASIRNDVKTDHEDIIKGSDYSSTGGGITDNIYKNSEITIHEVFEWLQPFKDKYAVMVNEVPIFKKGFMPNPYDFKETFFIGTPYLTVPGEYEGYGLPMLLENPQIMLNTIKNQRIDAMTLNIHKMWLVNPLANINKDELVTRPFGIIYSADPNGAREITSSDIKPSVYKEEDLLKNDMRYAAGVDDFSMGGGGSAASATEVRHLRESTLERVRLFVNHLGNSYAKLLRYWIAMYRQFFTEEMVIRITGDDGKTIFPLIEKNDLKGKFDFKATVIPSIAGQNDIKKKQDMDLLQLLIDLPFIDQEKLVSKILYDWNWDIENIKKEQEEAMVSPEQLPPGQMMNQEALPKGKMGGAIPEDVAQKALSLFEGAGTQSTPFNELSSPVNLLKTQGQIPPTPRGVPKGKTTNPRGLNRGGKTNTNIPIKETFSEESKLQNRAQNIQR